MSLDAAPSADRDHDQDRTADPVLAIRDLTVALPKGADRPHAVHGVSLNLRPGEILCLVGESGSGKSVLAGAILNDVPDRLRITAGEVIFDGQDVLKLSGRALNRLRGARIAMIYQEPMAALNPAMKVGPQVEEVFHLHRPEIGASGRRAETLRLFEEMRLPDPLRIYGAYPHEISGGQCQRVVIAMALACKPDLLIADEPTTALDVTTQAEILRLIADLRDSYGNAVLFITHDFGVVADIADRVAVMCGGALVEEGSRDQVLTRPREDYTRFLVDAMPALETTRSPDPIRTDLPVIAARGLGKVYGEGAEQVQALKGAGFALRSGETLGVVGESGSGKSTLAKTLIRLVEPSEGEIILGDEDFRALKGRDLREARQRIQMIFQDPWGSLNPAKTVGEIVTRGAILRGVRAADARAQGLRLLDMVGLGPEAWNRRPAHFSGGQRQRIGIARALSMQPDVVIADESVSALDLSVQKQVLRLMNDLQQRLEVAILFITHDLRVAAQVSDYIAVMRAGEMVEFGPAAEVFHAARHPYTRALLDAAPGRGWQPPRLSEAEAARIAAALQRA